MKPDKIRRRLGRALADGSLILLQRGVDRYPAIGYVGGLGPDWLLLRRFHYARFQEWEALRIDDVTSVRFDRTFLAELLQQRGEDRAAPPPIHLGDTNSLLASVAANFPLASLHTERTTGLLHIGRIVKLGRRSVTLTTIDRYAAWNRTERIRYADITRIDFGGPYEAALWEAGASSAPATGYHDD